MSDDNTRLIEWLRAKRGELSYAQFAELAGVAKSSLQRFEAGASDLSAASRVSLARAFKDFPEWALDGDGSVPYKGDTGTAVRTHRAQEPSPKLSAWISRDSEYVELPLYDLAASAGAGKWNESIKVKTYLQFRRDWLMWTCGTTAGLGLITVVGDSMSKTVPDGSVVMVRELPTYNLTEGIYFMCLDGHHMIKRVKPIELVSDGLGKVALRADVLSDNDDQRRFPPREIVFSEAQMHENRILARAVWYGVKLP